MRLRYPSEWRIRPPISTIYNTETIPQNVRDEFIGLIRRTAAQGDSQHFFEKYKRFYCLVNGNPYNSSSSLSWAENDLVSQIDESANNPPRFLEAFYNASINIHEESENIYYPSHEEINGILIRNRIGYTINPPNLEIIDQEQIQIDIEEPIQPFVPRGFEILQRSLERSEELLLSHHGREAVQECLWLLESISTAFQGIETETGTVEGNYFNSIMNDLRRMNRGTTSERVIHWIIEMHGYLSSPSGGGVRHGLDLNSGIELSENDSRLFCNLIRSYLNYLLIEHSRLSS